ncbi:MAG: TIM barrel protein [Clostridia bacterium]
MVKFGPSGNADSFYADGNKLSEQAPKWLNLKGLQAYEYSFGRGVNISETKALAIATEVNNYGIEISVHAPYYINFANNDEEMIKKSFGYLLKSADKARRMGGKRIVFHCATMGKAKREDAFSLTIERMKQLTEIIYEKGYDDLLFCPETMGKINQIGTLQEIAQLCKLDKVFYPTIDFGHLNARSHGGMNSIEAFNNAFIYLYNELEKEKVLNIHIHFSKIEYSQGGEVRHLTFADTEYGPDFEFLAPALIKYANNAIVICESDKTQAEDAINMMNIYKRQYAISENNN